MFKPKMYKSNSSEAYHLVSDEGGSFMYEGRIEYSEAELFKDDQGKAYYLVTTDIGSPSKYYVEVEPEGKPIPTTNKDKAISDLMRTTPEDRSPEIPAQAPEPEAAPEPIAVPEPVKQPEPIDTIMAKLPRETCFETPEKPAEEPKQEAPVEKPSTTEEAHAAVKAMASLGEHKPRKKSRLPLMIALLFVILIIVGAGIAVSVYRPGLISGLNLPAFNQATPTPEPTIMPVPTATPTPTPTPVPSETVLPGGSDIYKNLLMISPMINSSDPSVARYAADHSNPMGTSFSDLSLVCDLFDAVNKDWTQTNDNGIPQNVSLSASTTTGSLMDYSIFMASLVEAEGMDSRVVAVYNDDTQTYIYYPEVKAAPNDSDYNDALAYLRGRYNITSPYVHNDGIVHWLSLSMNRTPGGYVDTKFAYTVNSNNEITGV